MLYINDLNQPIKFCKVHHFADETNLLCHSSSIKKLNKSVKYVGAKINANLTLQHHLNDRPIKLNRVNAALFKMTKHVSPKRLISICFAIFDSYLSYCCLVWAQNFSTIQQIVILRKNAIRIANFFLAKQNLKLLGQKSQHFSNDPFQSYYYLFQVN